jgi:hypothetical protein
MENKGLSEESMKNKIEENKDSDSREKNLSKTGEGILIRLSSALKTAQIYEPNNLTFLRQINLLFTTVTDALKDENEVMFQLRENTLFFNSVRVKFDFSNYHSFKFLVDHIRDKDIVLLSF